jgi:NTE family protein
MRPLLTLLTLAALTLNGCATAPPPAPKPVKIGLALGGGAARGFAHVGVIKALENQGIFADIIVGTSAGAVVGALYASGNNGF